MNLLQVIELNEKILNTVYDIAAHHISPAEYIEDILWDEDKYNVVIADDPFDGCPPETRVLVISLEQVEREIEL
ncbi:hypothetical protein NVP1081O_179 [Vibrio phage 1.081.O._10N.286.52.C2]|nr:hypothetical protein NVP1081O_179 [Vibrio phage 1.081.O._10N.286.52.C2]